MLFSVQTPFVLHLVSKSCYYKCDFPLWPVNIKTEKLFVCGILSRDSRHSRPTKVFFLELSLWFSQQFPLLHLFFRHEVRLCVIVQ